jgi:hypothetical protein
VSTRTSQTFMDASPGKVARADQVHQKQPLQGERSKNGSAGFAQILGAQVPGKAARPNHGLPTMKASTPAGDDVQKSAGTSERLAQQATATVPKIIPETTASVQVAHDNVGTKQYAIPFAQFAPKSGEMSRPTDVSTSRNDGTSTSPPSATVSTSARLHAYPSTQNQGQRESTSIPSASIKTDRAFAPSQVSDSKAYAQTKLTEKSPSVSSKPSAPVAQLPSHAGATTIPLPVVATNTTSPSVPATTRATGPDIHARAPAVLPVERQSHAKGENGSVGNPAIADRHVIAEPAPAPEQKKPSRIIGTQTAAIAQFGSAPTTQPNPATVPQQNTPAQASRTHEPTSPPEASRPVATGRAPAKATIAKPTMEVTVPPDGTKQRELPSDAKTPPSGVNQSTASGETSARTTTDTTIAANSNQPPAPLAQDAGQVKTKSSVAPVASKRRAGPTDDKDPEEVTAASAKPPMANPVHSLTPPSPAGQLKPSKQEASQFSAHRDAGENLSQTSSTPSAAPSHTMKEELHPAAMAPAERSGAFASQGVFLPPTGDTARGEVFQASPIAAERAALVDRAVEDPGLSMNVMPHSAHLSIASDAGDLSLHVRVRDGSADVNVSGSMAPLFDAKAPEVRTVLAGEGLQLGSFATDQRGSSQGQQQGQPESAPATQYPHPLPPPRRAATSTPEVHIADDRRIHITA